MTSQTNEIPLRTEKILLTQAKLHLIYCPFGYYIARADGKSQVRQCLCFLFS